MLEKTDEHRLFRNEVERFVEGEIRPNVAEWEKAGRVPRELWAKAAELGLLGIEYPARFGGAELDCRFSAIRSRALGHAGCAGAILGLQVQSDMATPALARHGSEELREQFLSPAIRGETICAIAVSEPGAGSNVRGIETTVGVEGDMLRIRGQKTYVTNGTQADWLCLLARGPTQDGFSLIVVPTDTPGVEVSGKLAKLGHRSSDTADIFLDDVRVPRRYVIGDEGLGLRYQYEQFSRERFVLAWDMLGEAERAHQLAGAYAAQRQVAGGPLIDQDETRRKLAESEVDLLGLLGFLVSSLGELQEGRDLELLSSAAKLLAARTARRVIDRSLQLHGAAGLMEGTELERAYRDARAFSIGGGTDEMMLKIIAKHAHRRSSASHHCPELTSA